MYALVETLRQWHMYRNKFIVRSDHSPLITIRKRDPRGKIARWLMELEEYDFEIEHVTGTKNVKADFLTRISTTTATPPDSPLNEHTYNISNKHFTEQLIAEQSEDRVINRAKAELQDTGIVTMGRLKRVKKELRIEKDILTKSGRPVIPKKMYNYITDTFHKQDDIKSHFGIEKTYTAVKPRFYWPNMNHALRTFRSSCKICQQCKTDTKSMKAQLVPLVVPEKPMHFICIDIAYMEPDSDGCRYILHIGCVFSKFITAVS